MGTWHETMMRSSDSFRECHEGRGGSGCPCNIMDLLVKKTEMINDYISISNQGDNHYWSLYDSTNGLEIGKNYTVVINNTVHSVACTDSDGKPVLVNDSINIRYNTELERYLIDYYPQENIGSNPTVNFEVYEVEYVKIPAECLPE